MTCQKEGNDADELRKRVMALKEEVTLKFSCVLDNV